MIRQIQLNETYLEKGLRVDQQVKWKYKKMLPEGGKVRKFLSQDQALTDVNNKLKPVSDWNLDILRTR